MSIALTPIYRRLRRFFLIGVILPFFIGGTVFGESDETGPGHTLSSESPDSASVSGKEMEAEENSQDEDGETPWYQRLEFSGDFRSRHTQKNKGTQSYQPRQEPVSQQQALTSWHRLKMIKTLL